MVTLETLEQRALFSAIGLAIVGALSSETVPQTATEAQLPPAAAGSGTTATVAALATMASPAPQVITTARRVSVFSWSQPQDASSFDAMILVTPYQNPIAEADSAAPILNARRSGDRALMIAYVDDFFYPTMDRQNPAPFVASGPDIGSTRDWSQAFFARLKELGVAVDRVAVDSEGNFSTWYLLSGLTGEQRVARMQSIYDYPEAYARFPASVCAYAPADYADLHTIRGRAAYIAWNDWAFSVGDQAIKDAIVEPAMQWYGPDIIVGNYGDMSPRTPLLDRNGWPWADANASIPGNVSSPSTYLWNGQTYAKYQKDWRWNRLIDVLNVVRACQNVPNTTVTPWISFPSFAGDGVAPAQSTWLWEQMVRHMAAGGVDSFYYWNPPAPTTRTDDQMADWLFQRLRVGTPTTESLQPIPFDADVVVTGNVQVTYAEFLTYVDLPLTKRLDGPDQFTGPILPPVDAVVNATLSSQLSATAAGTASQLTRNPFCGPTAQDKIDFAAANGQVDMPTVNTTFAKTSGLTAVQPKTVGSTFASVDQPMPAFDTVSSRSDDTALRSLDQLFEENPADLSDLLL